MSGILISNALINSWPRKRFPLSISEASKMKSRLRSRQQNIKRLTPPRLIELHGRIDPTVNRSKSVDTDFTTEQYCQNPLSPSLKEASSIWQFPTQDRASWSTEPENSNMLNIVIFDIIIRRKRIGWHWKSIWKAFPYLIRVLPA